MKLTLNNIIFDFGEYRAVFEPLPKGIKMVGGYPASYEVTILKGNSALCAFYTSQYRAQDRKRFVPFSHYLK